MNTKQLLSKCDIWINNTDIRISELSIELSHIEGERDAYIAMRKELISIGDITTE